MRNSYPLQWPVGRPRAPGYARRRAAFQVTEGFANKELLREIKMLGGIEIVITSEVRTKADGTPYIRQVTDDPGVAVYFTRNGREFCFACDKWDRIHHNIHAVALTINAIRGIERWGSGDMMEASMRGFAALPPPIALKPWYEVLGFFSSDVPIASCEDAYRRMSKKAHPDLPGGDANQMAELNRAIGEARSGAAA